MPIVGRPSPKSRALRDRRQILGVSQTGAPPSSPPPPSRGSELNVMDFGADGTGNPSIDDTNAFIDFFSAIQAAGLTGRRGRIPGGIYYVNPELMPIPSFCELDFEHGCAWLVRIQGTAGEHGLHSAGIGTGDPAVEIHIRGLTYDGNYIKNFDGANEEVNPSADPPGGPGGKGLAIYGEHITLENVRVKNAKGIGMELLGSHNFGAGRDNTGHQWDVRDIHVVNCYGPYGARLGIVDSLIDGVQVIHWDEDHTVTPYDAVDAPALPNTPVGQVGVVLASGGMKVSHGHIWGVGLYRALWAYSDGNVVSDMTCDSATDAGLWVTGNYNQMKNMDIYSLTPELGVTSKGIVMGSDDPAKDCWGNVIDAHIRNMGGGAIDWQRATRGNRVTATVVCETGDPDIIGDPTGGSDGGPVNVVDLIRLENP